MIDPTLIAQFGVRLARPAMVASMTPSLGGPSVPALVKVGLAVFLTIALWPVTALPASAPIDRMALVIAREVAIGFALALSGVLVLAVAEMAGSFVAFQLGFSYAVVVDPQTSARNNVLGVMYGMLAVLTFLAIDGHHAVIRALASSYDALPIGGGAVDASLVATVGRMLATVFSVGVRIASPIVVGLLVAEVGLGLLARGAPMLNVMAVGFSIRVFAGLLILFYTLDAVPRALAITTSGALELAARLMMAMK